MLMNHHIGQAPAAAQMRGVTLIELMIVIVIVAILASFAYPSYQNQVRKTRRADGMSDLMRTAQSLERCYTLRSNYTDATCNITFPMTYPDSHYVVTAPTLTASSFTLEATPQGHQATDTECGALRLSSNGSPGSQGTNSDANNCWK